MIVKKQYIPKRYRSKKLVNSGGGMVVGGSSTSGSSVDTSSFLLADKFTSLFEYDEVNDAIKAKLPFYSEGEISAYGYGGSGGGGGTGIVYNGLDSVITDIALSAYMGNVLNTNKLDVSTFNSWVANYVPPAPAWGDVTGKPSTFPAAAHVHGWGEIENKPTTFAPSAHTHTWDSIESKPNVITGTTASFTTALETKLNGIAAGANNYTHPATSGNKHIPAGGESGNILRWSADGTASWGVDNDTIYELTKAKVESVLTGAITSHTHAYEASGTTSAAMTAHLNAFAHGNIANGQTAFGWGNHASAGYALNSALSAHIGSNGNAHGLANATTAGFMGSSNFNKLAGIESGANNYTHPATHAPSIIVQDADNRFFTDTERTKLSGIATGAEVNVQSDWNAASGDAYILNKPTALPASDVYAWAKAVTKPSYIASEISGLGTNYRWLTDAYISTWNAKEPAITKGTTSQYFRGDMSLALFPTSLPASDVYSWAKAAVKPSYVWSEIGSKPTTLSGYGITDAVTLNTEQYIAANKTFTGGINGFVKQASNTNPTGQPVFINGTGGATLGESAAIGFHNPGRNYSSIVYHDGLFKFMNYQMSSYDGIMASTGNFTNLTANYIPKQTASGLANSMIYDNGTNVGIGTASPAALLDVNGIGKFKDDILMTFNTWTHATDKNSLKKFLGLFDIDAAGNLVVKTNLYSTGEVTAYSSGTGVSGLKLMGDLNANGKNITGANSVSAGDIVIGNDPLDFLDGDSPGLYNAGNDGIIAAYNNTAGKFYYANGNLIVDYSGVATSPTMQATEFKFGNWTFKQDASGRLGIYNGTTEVACFNTDGTYVNL